MKRIPSHCNNFREFRRDVLCITQAELATHCRCKQAWISAIERGHIPEPWTMVNILQGFKKLGYSLNRDDLKRLIEGKAQPINVVESIGVNCFSYSSNTGSVISYAS